MKQSGFHDYVMGEIFYDIAGIKSRPMFGGFGIYKDGVFFALIANDGLYFKVDAKNQPDFAKYKSKPFAYTMPNGKEMQMSYWELPTEIMENRDKLVIWIEGAVAAQERSKSSKQPKKKRGKSRTKK